MNGAVAALRREFDELSARGRRIGFWWRDDDAVADAPALERLLSIAAMNNLPVSLAVIPAAAQDSLADRVRSEDGLTVLVHGWSHANHAPAGDRTAEFGANRARGDMAREARAGLAAIADRFGAQALPVFVPPWNRIDPAFANALPDLGYRAVSCFGGGGAQRALARIDTHLDPVSWRGTRSLAEPETLVAMLRRALSRGEETIGLLTHHLVHDDALWSFCAAMAELVAAHPALRPLGLGDIVADRAAIDAAGATPRRATA